MVSFVPRLLDQCSGIVALYNNVFSPLADVMEWVMVDYRESWAAARRIDAAWLNANERWCCVCQGGLGCNLSAEAARSLNDIIRKCRQQRSNEE